MAPSKLKPVFSTLRRRLLEKNFNNNIARVIDMLDRNGEDPATARISFDPNFTVNSIIEALFEVVGEFDRRISAIKPDTGDAPDLVTRIADLEAQVENLSLYIQAGGHKVLVDPETSEVFVSSDEGVSQPGNDDTQETPVAPCTCDPAKNEGCNTPECKGGSEYVAEVQLTIDGGEEPHAAVAEAANPAPKNRGGRPKGSKNKTTITKGN